jgi:hypothetical protein
MNQINKLIEKCKVETHITLCAERRSAILAYYSGKEDEEHEDIRSYSARRRRAGATGAVGRRG